MNNNKQLTKSEQYVLYGSVGALAGACIGALAGVLLYDKDLRKKFADGYENLRELSYKMVEDIQEIQKERNKRVPKLPSEKKNP